MLMVDVSGDLNMLNKLSTTDLSRGVSVLKKVRAIAER